MTDIEEIEDRASIDGPSGAEDEAVAEVGRASALLNAVREEISRAIYGQDEVVNEALITLISGGHGLLVGVPGLAKTLLVETLAKVLGLSEKRVQFTPDLLPADILGSEVLEEGQEGKRSFRFIKGPIFCQLLIFFTILLYMWQFILRPLCSGRVDYILQNTINHSREQLCSFRIHLIWMTRQDPFGESLIFPTLAHIIFKQYKLL